MKITKTFYSYHGKSKDGNFAESMTGPDKQLIVDQPIHIDSLTRSASGGFQATFEDEDEFGNSVITAIVMEREDVDRIKELISAGLI